MPKPQYPIHDLHLFDRSVTFGLPSTVTSSHAAQAIARYRALRSMVAAAPPALRDGPLGCEMLGLALHIQDLRGGGLALCEVAGFTTVHGTGYRVVGDAWLSLERRPRSGTVVRLSQVAAHDQRAVAGAPLVLFAQPEHSSIERLVCCTEPLLTVAPRFR